MEWFLWALVPVVLALAALAGTGRFGALPPPVHDEPVVLLPDGPLTAADVRGAQFAVVARGYSVAQVDELLARVARELDDRTAGFEAVEPGLDHDSTAPARRALPDLR